jgi:hypothetical protein
MQSNNSTTTRIVVQANHATLVAWLVLNVWPSHFALPLLLLIITLSRKIQRHATFINMLIIWIIVGLSSSILLYAGDTTGPEPPKALCLFQASLLYTVPATASLAAFALVFEVFYLIWSAYRERDPQRLGAFRKWMLVVIPYVGLGLFATATATVGYMNPSSISRDRRFFYCSVESKALTDTLTLFSTVVLISTLGLETWIGLMLYKHWRILRENGLSKPPGGLNVSLVCRVVAFGTYVFLGISLSLLSMRAPDSPVPDMALATMGSAVVLIFGTQRDILRALCFWRTRQSPVVVQRGFANPQMRQSGVLMDA